MQRKILAGIVFVVGIFVYDSLALADSRDLLAFDEVYTNPRSAVKATAENISLSALSQTTRQESAIVPKKRRNPSIIMMKDLLKDVPADARSEFLNSFTFKNGRVVSVYLVPLKRTLTKTAAEDIVKKIFFHPESEANAVSGSDGAPIRFARISELLGDIPQDVRDGFLNSLTFKDGTFVSAYIGGLRKEMTRSRLEKTLKTIATTNGPVQEFNSKTLCGDGICIDSACTGGDGHPHPECVDSNGWTCDTACH